MAQPLPSSPFDGYDPLGGQGSGRGTPPPSPLPLEEPDPQWDPGFPPEAWDEPSFGEDQYEPPLPPEPSGYYADAAPEFESSAQGSRREGKRKLPDGITEEDVIRVVQTLRNVIAAQAGRHAAECVAMVQQIKSSSSVLELLDKDTHKVYMSLLEVLVFEFAGNERVVNFADLPSLHVLNKAVKDEVRAIGDMVVVARQAGDPTAAWSALESFVARRKAAAGAVAYHLAIENGESDAVLDELHRTLPSAVKAREVQVSVKAESAGEWENAIEAATGGRGLIRYSSGYYGLDWAMTGPGESLGYTAVGEFHIRAAGTGQGKSADASLSVPAAAQDMVNQGQSENLVVLAHTEEEVSVKLKQLGLLRGQRNHHLRDNIIISPVGSSRKALALTIYKLVKRAVDLAEKNGTHPKRYLPVVLFVDYLQSLREDGEREADAIANTAEYLLRGAVAFNPDEMEKFSGVSFRRTYGMAWPEGIDMHRMAVIAYAQLIKQEGASLYYKPGSKGTPESNFVMEGANGEHAWPLYERDQRLPTQDEVRGSGVLLQNATSLIFLHRSRPQGNPVIRPANGLPHLADTRARFILSKTRNGTNLLYVPMRFDSQPSGFRGQYYDDAGEHFMRTGRIKIDASWNQSGDPILPVRQRPSAFADSRY